MKNKINEEYMKKAREAISNLFSDVSVSPRTTLENMRTIQQEIEDYCSTLQEEIPDEE